MGIFDGCLLASDIDETLVSNGLVPERNKEKIKLFIENGGTFCMATGRLPSGAKCIAEQFENLPVSVYGNGCLAYDYENKQAVFEHLLPKEDYKAILKAKEIYPDMGIQCFYREEVRVLTVCERTNEHTIYEKISWLPIDAQELSEKKLNKTLYLCESFEHAEKLKAAISPLTTGSDFCNSSFIINGIQRHMLEQLPKGVSKSQGILELARVFNIKKGGIYAIGDYFNDMDMIRDADIGAATAGAPDEVKAVADITVGSAENGAVADFIDYLIMHS